MCHATHCIILLRTNCVSINLLRSLDKLKNDPKRHFLVRQCQLEKKGKTLSIFKKVGRREGITLKCSDALQASMWYYHSIEVIFLFSLL